MEKEETFKEDLQINEKSKCFVLEVSKNLCIIMNDSEKNILMKQLIEDKNAKLFIY